MPILINIAKVLLRLYSTHFIYLTLTQNGVTMVP